MGFHWVRLFLEMRIQFSTLLKRCIGYLNQGSTRIKINSKIKLSEEDWRTYRQIQSRINNSNCFPINILIFLVIHQGDHFVKRRESQVMHFKKAIVLTTHIIWSKSSNFLNLGWKWQRVRQLKLTVSAVTLVAAVEGIWQIKAIIQILNQNIILFLQRNMRIILTKGFPITVMNLKASLRFRRCVLSVINERMGLRMRQIIPVERNRSIKEIFE